MLQLIDNSQTEKITYSYGYQGNPWAAPGREQTVADRVIKRRICNKRDNIMTSALIWVRQFRWY